MNASPASRWDCIEELGAGQPQPDETVELPESGWGALIAWVSGPSHVIRQLDTRQHLTQVVEVRDGAHDTYTEPRSETEQTTLDNDIDQYLRDADVPARPHGYRWFLRLPQGMTGDMFWHHINSALIRTRTRPTHPREIAAALNELLREPFGT